MPKQFQSNVDARSSTSYKTLWRCIDTDNVNLKTCASWVITVFYYTHAQPFTVKIDCSNWQGNLGHHNKSWRSGRGSFMTRHAVQIRILTFGSFTCKKLPCQQNNRKLFCRWNIVFLSLAMSVTSTFKALPYNFSWAGCRVRIVLNILLTNQTMSLIVFSDTSPSFSPNAHQ